MVIAPGSVVRVSVLGIERAKVIGVRVRPGGQVRYEVAWEGRSAWVTARHVEPV